MTKHVILIHCRTICEMHNCVLQRICWQSLKVLCDVCCGEQGCSAAAFCIISCKCALKADIIRFKSQFHRRSRLSFCVVIYIIVPFVVCC